MLTRSAVIVVLGTSCPAYHLRQSGSVVRLVALEGISMHCITSPTNTTKQCHHLIFAVLICGFDDHKASWKVNSLGECGGRAKHKTVLGAEQRLDSASISWRAVSRFQVACKISNALVLANMFDLQLGRMDSDAVRETFCCLENMEMGLSESW